MLDRAALHWSHRRNALDAGGRGECTSDEQRDPTCRSRARRKGGRRQDEDPISHLSRRARHDAAGLPFRVVAPLRTVRPGMRFFRAKRRGEARMKTRIAASLLAAGALASAGTALAAPPQVREVGVGVALGEPIGGSAKLWFDGPWAADLGAGLS